MNLLVLGSGFSLHNMSAFIHNDHGLIAFGYKPFQNWLINVVTGKLTRIERE